MARLCISILALSLSILPVAADTASFVLATDRRSNPELIRLMTDGNIEEALEIARWVGRRDDAYAGDIIGYFFNRYQGRRRFEADLILVTLLVSLFPADQPDRVFQDRYTLNADVLNELISSSEYFESSDVRALCLRLAGRSGEPSFIPLIARSGERIVRGLSASAGLLSSEAYTEAMLFLEAAGRTRSRVLRYPVIDIARFAADKTVVAYARRTLGLLQ